MRKKLYGTAKYLNKVYTQNGGEANYEDKLETKGILKLALIIGQSFVTKETGV